jgi:polyhydroxyalkanoate synthase
MSTTTTTAADDAPARDLSAPLDALLVDAAAATTLHRWLPGRETVALAGALARRPRTVTDTVANLAAELGRVAAGTSAFEASARDRRFADSAWRDNPLLRRSLQAYLAASAAAQRLVDEAGLEGANYLRIRFLVDNLLDALAPSNAPWLNPAALKEVVNTGGGSVVRGLRNLAGDLAQPPRVPSMVDETEFSVGGNLGITPGAVVLRTPVFELIQYAPSTEDVRQKPLLLVPPTINKFYVLDLAPGRSLVEHLVSSGQQVFAISWRNPTAQHADWGLDAYVGAVIEALDTTREIAESDEALMFGACSGGIIASTAAAYLADAGRQDELAGLTLAVTVLDQSNAGLSGALMDEARAEAAIESSERRGYLDGRALAEVFAWLRPNDLIWNYWVNNYLLGKKPPAFDILYWNADTTRMPARLHKDFLEMAMGNKLVHPGEATVMGVPVDLGKVTVDSYMVGGVADHITPWDSCYRSTGLFGGTSRFILSTSGHIAALVNPATNMKSSFQTHPEGDPNPQDPKAWQASAETHQGSWWNDYADWLGARSGDTRTAPTELGRGRFAPLAEAPGTYVHDK